MGLIIFLGVVVALILASAAFGYTNRPSPNISKDDLAALKMTKKYETQRADLAEQGLRQIANGDAMPVITASDYLDRLNRKEIS